MSDNTQPGREYHHPPGYEPTVKPLALYQDRLKSGQDPTDARADFYLEIQEKWLRARPAISRKPWSFYRNLFSRHEHKIVDLALRELKRHDRAAA